MELPPSILVVTTYKIIYLICNFPTQTVIISKLIVRLLCMLVFCNFQNPDKNHTSSVQVQSKPMQQHKGSKGLGIKLIPNDLLNIIKNMLCISIHPLSGVSYIWTTQFFLGYMRSARLRPLRPSLTGFLYVDHSH